MRFEIPVRRGAIDQRKDNIKYHKTRSYVKHGSQCTNAGKLKAQTTQPTQVLVNIYKKKQRSQIQQKYINDQCGSAVSKCTPLVYEYCGIHSSAEGCCGDPVDGNAWK